MAANESTVYRAQDTKGWATVIQVVQTPLGLFTLVILAVQALLSVLLMTDALGKLASSYVAYGMVALLFLIVIMVSVIVIRRPELLTKRGVSETRPGSPDVEMAPSTSEEDKEVAAIVREQGADVLFSTETQRPTLGFWFRELRPFLHQAAHYTIPTYYLDTKLNVVDWNIAFEIVFGELVGQLRGKHVNWFIARLANHDDVFNHARGFTRDVIEKGTFPYVDVEPIEYDSSEFGRVRTFKVAAQLTDTEGAGKAWSVALVPKEINWERFEEKLYGRIQADKMWSMYAASYDRILSNFGPYRTLIEDVVSVVPDSNLSVADLGSGTGNVTKSLLERGHRVTAIEDNLGMLDRFAAKQFDPERVQFIKSSVEHLEFVAPRSFDAVVMVNLLYALDHPLECLHSVHRMLRPGGVLGLSTTHRETELDPLLNSIRADLEKTGRLTRCAQDWDTVYKVNKTLERTVVRRHTRDEIREMVGLAGFDIIKDVPATYEGSVMLIHARKRGGGELDSRVSSVD